MKIIIFGLGSIGERHSRLLLEHFDCEVYAFRSSKQKGGNKLGIKEIYSWREVRKLKADIAFITNPTFLHLKTAIDCASLGMHLFIEKPLGSGLSGLSKLKKICRTKGLTCYIAYCLRFHQVILKAKELLKNKKLYHVRIACSSYLPDWRKRRDEAASYSESKKQGGGVLLDLSHEFDYIQFLFGPINSIQGVFGRVSEITIDSEDFSDAIIKTKAKLYINLHLNFNSHLVERSIKVDFSGGYIFADIIKSTVEYFNRGKIQRFQFSKERNNYYLKQLQFFMANYKNRKKASNVDESGDLLGKILEFKNG